MVRAKPTKQILARTQSIYRLEYVNLLDNLSSGKTTICEISRFGAGNTHSQLVHMSSICCNHRSQGDTACCNSRTLTLAHLTYSTGVAPRVNRLASSPRTRVHVSLKSMRTRLCIGRCKRHPRGDSSVRNRLARGVSPIASHVRCQSCNHPVQRSIARWNRWRCRKRQEHNLRVARYVGQHVGRCRRG